MGKGCPLVPYFLAKRREARSHVPFFRNPSRVRFLLALASSSTLILMSILLRGLMVLVSH